MQSHGLFAIAKLLVQFCADRQTDAHTHTHTDTTKTVAALYSTAGGRSGTQMLVMSFVSNSVFLCAECRIQLVNSLIR